jgi:DNA replication and repair protein RecF
VHLTHLSLTNFRNYKRLGLEFPPGPLLVRGDNAQGKTNLLEAIYFLSTTRTPFARADRQLINWLSLEHEVLPFARVEGTIRRSGNTFELAITVVQDNNSFHKDIRLNGAKKRALEVIGRLTTVMFLPEDIELVTGRPDRRRRYLDTTLCQIDPDYCLALSQFNKTLTQRNALLKQLQDQGGDLDQLTYWDEQLTQSGAFMIARRHDSILDLDLVARQRHREVSGGKEGLRLYYAPSFDPHDRPAPNYQLPLALEDLGARSIPAPPPRQIAEAYLAKLRSERGQDIGRGVTQVGPHRDDLHFLVDGIDMTLYGSRGQQRTAALSTKLAEIELMRQITGETPVLLLDDVMSELDAERRGHVLNMIANVGQALATTTDWEDYAETFRSKAHLFQVVGGRVEALQPLAGRQGV